MGTSDFAILAKAIRSVYGDKVIGDQDAFTVWYDMLKDLDYDIASKALQRYMMTSKFPPTIADIREQYFKLVEPQEQNGMEAWDLVSKAIRNSAYHSQEEFDKLPPLVQRSIGSARQLYYMAIDENYNEAVARSNFLKVYENECTRHQTDMAIPESIRQLEHETAERLVHHG